MRLQLLVVLVVASCQLSQAARILAVLPNFGKSHHIIFRAVLNTLAARGHEIVCYTALKLDSASSNYTEILMEKNIDVEAGWTVESFAWVRKVQVAANAMIWAKELDLVSGVFDSSHIKDLLKSKEHFDLVIIEPFFAQEALLGFGHRFRAPVVSIHTAGAHSVVNRVTGNSLSLASIPDATLPYSNHMTFIERAVNSFSILTTLALYYHWHLPYQEKLAREFFNDPSMPSVVDMVHSIPLVVTNAHPFVQYAQPSSPNIVDVGGIHIPSNVKPLPKDIKAYLDQAEYGVIYFSFGSVAPDHLLPQRFYDNFINVFRRLPQRVLWKTKHQAKNLPKNVMTVSWAPQLEILSHPKTMLFITHGGLLSQHEAIHSGVPVVCIPVFADQHGNGRFYEERKIGVRILFDELSEESIEAGIRAVLTDRRYQENMQRLSLVYRDRPVSASDSLVFWVEYVLRNRGSAHLRPASSLMPWYQLAMLDVLAAVGVTIVISIVISFLITVKMFRLLVALNRKVKNIKNKNN